MKKKVTRSDSSSYLGFDAARPIYSSGERFGSSPRIDAKIEASLGENLRQVYREVLEEPVPQRFVTLLDELARKAQS